MTQASTAKKQLLYLHGFRSSPASAKAQQLLGYVSRLHPDIECLVPQLPFSPRAAMQVASDMLASASNPVLVGSSLGGYYVNFLAEQHQCKAVMVNPAIHPYELLQDYLGPQNNPYSGESYTLTEEHMVELRGYRVERLSVPGRRLLLLQTGDETLDFQQASRQFSSSPTVIEYGGNHAFVAFERWLPRIAHFLEL